MSKSFEFVYLVSEVIVMILFITCTKYGEGVHPKNMINDEATAAAGDVVITRYPQFIDVHVMIFLGIGFLLVFLKSHSWASVGINFIIGAYSMQLSILSSGFWIQAFSKPMDEWERIPLTIENLIVGDFGAATVLISFCCLLGKVSLSQMWCFATLEVIFWALNESICVHEFRANDMGGSMYVHTFAAYFGLAATYFFDPKKAIEDKEKQCEGNYNSQLIAMVGTIFLWILWPSFNGALAGPAAQQRVFINTVLAMSGSCITACAMARIIY